MSTTEIADIVPASRRAMPERRPELSGRQFEWIASTVYKYCGIHLPPAKHQSVEGRLMPRVRALGLAGLQAYLKHLGTEEGGKQEFVHFIDAITINKTDFFREPAHFDLLTRQVAPELAESTGAGRRYPLRIWSAGCSSGEEPYSIAMVMSEYAANHRPYAFSVLATDICQEMLERAVRGVYPLESFAAVPDGMRKKYLLRPCDQTRTDGRVAPEIRELVEFRRLNLMDRELRTGGPLDVIFCRNVMIYFSTSGREDLVRRLIGQLRVGGHILVGHSETLNTMKLPVVSVAPTVFRKVV